MGAQKEEPTFAHPRLLFILKALCKREGLTTVSFYRTYVFAQRLQTLQLKRTHKKSALMLVPVYV
jgi:hypothetical protein